MLFSELQAHFGLHLKDEFVIVHPRPSHLKICTLAPMYRGLGTPWWKVYNLVAWCQGYASTSRCIERLECHVKANVEV